MLPLQFFDAWAGTLAIIALIAIGIVMTVIWIYIAIWVYRDARDRGMDAAIWLIIIILLGIIGLIIYLVVRD
ncbi:MAG: PLDc N-terminal domain-containing protein [Candidatus Lokiarchaeia archaeon]